MPNLEDYEKEANELLNKNSPYAMGEEKAILDFIPLMLNDGKTVQHQILYNDIKKLLHQKGYDEEVPSYSPDAKNEFTLSSFNVGDGSKNSQRFQHYRKMLKDVANKNSTFLNLTETHKKRIIDNEAIALTSFQNYVEDNLPKDLSSEDKKDITRYQNAYLKGVWLPTVKRSIDRYAQEESVHRSSEYWKIGLANATAGLFEGVSSSLPTYLGGQDKGLFDRISDHINEYSKTFETGTGMFSLTDAEAKAEYGVALDIPFTDVDIPTLKENYALHKVIEAVASNPTSIAMMASAMRGGGKTPGFKNQAIGTLKNMALPTTVGYLIETGYFQREFEENLLSQKEMAELQRKMLPDGDEKAHKDFFEEFKIEIDDGQYITADKLDEEQINNISRGIAREYGMYSTMAEAVSSVGFSMGSAAFRSGKSLVSAKYLRSKSGQQAMANQWYKKIGKKFSGKAGWLSANMLQEGLTERFQENMNIELMDDYLANYKKLSEEEKQERLSSATFGGMAMGGVFEGARGIYNIARNVGQQTPEAEFTELNDQEAKAYREQVQEIKSEIETASKNKKPFINMVDQSVILRSLKDSNMKFSQEVLINSLNAYKSVTSIHPNGVNEIIIDQYFQARRQDGTLTNNKKLLAVLKHPKTSKVLLNKLEIDAGSLKNVGISDIEIKAVFPNYIPPKQKAKSVNTKYTSNSDIPLQSTGKINQTNTSIDQDIAEVSASLTQNLKIKDATKGQLEIRTKLKARLDSLKKQRDSRTKVQNNNAQLDSNTFRAPLKDGQDPVLINRVFGKKLADHKLKSVVGPLPSDGKDNIEYGFKVVGVSQGVNPLTNKKEKVYNVVPTPKSFDTFKGLFGKAPPKNSVYQIYESEIAISVDASMKRYKPQEGVKAPITKNKVAEKQNMPQPKGIRLAVSDKKNGLKEVLDYIAVNSDNKRNKGIATLLKKGLKNKISIDFNGALKTAGVFSVKNNSIQLSPRGKTDIELEDLILHEAVHGLTSEKIKLYKNNKLKKNTKAYKSVKQLDEIYNTIKDGLSKDEETSIKALQTLIADVKTGKISKKDITSFQKELKEDFYGFTKLEEFVAELMTNPRFQQKLQKIKYQNSNKSLLDKVKELIIKIFNIDKTDNALFNALANAINVVGSDIIRTEPKEKGMTFSSFDQPIEVGDLKNTTTATISDLAYIRPNFETILEAFKKSKKKTMKAFMSLAPRLIENYRLIKSESGDILILEDGKAIGEIKADETEKGLRTESLILGKGKKAIIVNNVVSVNNADTQVAKYNIPPIKSEKITQNISKPKAKPTKTTKSGVTLYKKLYSNLSNQFDAFANLIKQTMNVVGLSKGERLWNKYASWYGDVDYTYSGKTHKMQEMPSEIQAIARNIEQQLGIEEGYFNSALANVFPRGQQLGEHADDEKIFVRENKTIGKVATVSLGGSTKIIIRNVKTNKKESILVQDGDLYVMPGQTFQIEHKHSVTPTQGERVSITYRHIPKSRLLTKKAANIASSNKGQKPEGFLNIIANADMDKEELTDDVITTGAQNVVDDIANNLGEPEPSTAPDPNIDGIEEDFPMDGFNENIDERDYNIFSGLGFNKGNLQRNDQKRANDAFEYLWLELQTRFDVDQMFWSSWKNMMQNRLEGTVFSKQFKKWSDGYQVQFDGASDYTGVHDGQFIVEFDDKKKGDLPFSPEEAKKLVDIAEWTEETVRQGLNINDNGLEKETKSVNTGKIENSFFRAIEYIPTAKQNIAIAKSIEDANSFDDWVNLVSSDQFIMENGFFLAGNRKLIDFFDYDADGVLRNKFLRFYLSGLPENRTPTNRGKSQKGAIRTLYGIYTANTKNDKDPIYKFRFMNHRNRVINRYNTPNKMRTRAIERTKQFDTQDLIYLSINDLYRWVQNDNPKSKYKVRTVSQEGYRFDVTAFTRSLMKADMVPLMIRGDSELVPIVRLTKEDKIKGYVPEKYWAEELGDLTTEEQLEFAKWGEGYLANEKTDEYLKEVVGFSGKNGIARLNAVNIARHKAYKKMFGDDYWKYLSGHKMFTRSKLIFGQGTVNPNMPSQDGVIFDPRIDLGEKSKARVVLNKRNGEDFEFPLVKKLGSTWQYKWDGKLLTSEEVHAETYPKYLGTNKKARRAKTSFYQRGNTGAMAWKHQEMTYNMRPDVESAEIYDGNGIHVATIKKDSRGYNQIFKEGEDAGVISYLGTPDENKFATGEYANSETRSVHFNKRMTLKPTSINLIQYPRDKDKSYGKMMPQLMNYHSDIEAQTAAIEMFKDSDPRKKFSPNSLLNVLKDVMSDSNKLSIFMKNYVKAEIDNMPMAFTQNAMLNAGNHPTQTGMNKNIIKNAIMNRIVDFHTYGSTLDINMDPFGDVKDDEAVIPFDHNISKNILNIMKAKTRASHTNFSLDEVNTWLKTLRKPIEVLIIRSPVPQKNGYIVAKIKELQSIGDTIVLGDGAIKNDLEADGDGDKVTIVMANNENKKLVEILKERHQSIEPLSYEKGGSNLNIADISQMNMLIQSMIKGQGSINQIATISRSLGIIKTWFKSITIETEKYNMGEIVQGTAGTTMRGPTKSKDDKFQQTKSSGKRKWKIVMRDLDKEMVYDHGRGVKDTVARHYYHYLQASFDHGQFLLLDKWEYSRNRLYEMAFKYENESGEAESIPYGALREEVLSENNYEPGNGILHPDHLEMIIENLLMPTAEVGQLLSGIENGKPIPFSNHIEKSRRYLDFIENRKKNQFEFETKYEQSYKYTIEGKNEINSLHETMATAVSSFIDENRLDASMFEISGEHSKAVNIKVMRENIDEFIEMGNILAISDAGFNESDFNKLSKEEKMSIMRKSNQDINKAHTDAINFKTDISRILTKVENRSKEDNELIDDVPFDVNKWSFDPLARNIYEKWIDATKNYTKSQRFQFTLKFLFDTANPDIGYRQRDIRMIPPSSRITESSIFDPDLMEVYFTSYNKINDNYNENMLKDSGWMESLYQLNKYEWEKSGCIS